MKVFISYSRQTEPVVRTLVDDIGQLGHDVWFDQELCGGQAWWDQILSSIRDCDLFVLALAPEALSSVACQREYGYAGQLGKPILPVLVADGVRANLLPPLISKIQFVDYRAKDRAAGLSLAKAISTVPPPQPLPEPLLPPPELPVSYLGSLRERIEASTRLNEPEQSALLVKLKRSLDDPKTSEDAHTLLQNLRRRRDLLATIAEEVDQLLSGPTARPAAEITSREPHEEGLHPWWLVDEPPTCAVFWVKIIRQLIENPASSLGRTEGSRTEWWVERAEVILELLRLVRDIRIRFDEREHPRLVRFRFLTLLRRIVRDIGNRALDDQSTRRSRAKLYELEKWLDPAQLPELYQKSLARSINLLVMQIRLEGFPEEHRERIEELLNSVKEIKALGPSKHLSPEFLRAEENFTKLKLLWERCDEGEYEELIECLRDGDVQDFFNVADQAAWKRLCEAAGTDELEICTPQTTGGVIRAFEPILFEVRTKSRALDVLQLFHSELTWDWRIRIEPEQRRHLLRWLVTRKETFFLLTPRSTEPKLIQYAPESGHLLARVTISFDRAPHGEQRIEVAGKPLLITR